MDEILRQLENGEFTQYDHTLRLKSGTYIWTSNGRSYYHFWPGSGDAFTFSEKMKIGRAIKKGRIKQALTPNT